MSATDRPPSGLDPAVTPLNTEDLFIVTQLLEGSLKSNNVSLETLVNYISENIDFLDAAELDDMRDSIQLIIDSLGNLTDQRVIATGDGLTGGGDLTDDREISMLPPADITVEGEGFVDETGHGHKLDMENLKENLDDRYMQSSLAPFSRIGKIGERFLPITDNLFSLTIPNQDFVTGQIAAFNIENNGDMLALIPYTNGEIYSYGYCRASGYINSDNDLSELKSVNQVYRPAGLETYEIIGNIISKTDGYMIAEVHELNATNINGKYKFKEHAYIKLNRSLYYDLHIMTRLGNKLLNAYGYSSTDAEVEKVQLQQPSLVDFKGRRFIISLVYSNDFGASEFLEVFELDSSNIITKITGWEGTIRHGAFLADGSITNSSTVSLPTGIGIAPCNLYKNQGSNGSNYWLMDDDDPGIDRRNIGLSTENFGVNFTLNVTTASNRIITRIDAPTLLYFKDSNNVSYTGAYYNFKIPIDLYPTDATPRYFFRRLRDPNSPYPSAPYASSGSSGVLDAEQGKVFSDPVNKKRSFQIPADVYGHAKLIGADRTYRWAIVNNTAMISHTQNSRSGTIRTLIDHRFKWDGLKIREHVYYPISELVFSKDSNLTIDGGDLISSPNVNFSAFMQKHNLHDRYFLCYGTTSSTLTAKDKGLVSVYKRSTTLKNFSTIDKGDVNGYTNVNDIYSVSTYGDFDPIIFEKDYNGNVHRGFTYFFNSASDDVKGRSYTLTVDDVEKTAELIHTNTLTMTAAVKSNVSAVITNMIPTITYHDWFILVSGVNPNVAFIVISADEPSGLFVEIRAVNVNVSGSNITSVTITNDNALRDRYISVARIQGASAGYFLERTKGSLSAAIDFSNSGNSEGILWISPPSYFSGGSPTSKKYRFSPTELVLLEAERLDGYSTITMDDVLGTGIMNTGYGAGTLSAFEKLNTDDSDDVREPVAPIIMTSVNPVSDFSIIVNEDLACFLAGVRGDIPPETIPLNDPLRSDILGSLKNISVNVYVRLTLGEFGLFLSESEYPETDDNIYLGTVKTNDDFIYESSIKPISRFDVYRPSLNPVGSAFSVSTGVPSSPNLLSWATSDNADGVLNPIAGYAPLPNGMILQWGTVYLPNLDSNTDITVTPPIAFPTACVHVDPNPLFNDDNAVFDTGRLLIRSISPTAFEILVRHGVTPGNYITGFTYSAIGY